MPKPDCSARPSNCEDLDLINTLDGFNLQPRLSIPFDGPIDVNSVTSQTVFLISLGDTLDPRDRGGKVVGKRVAGHAQRSRRNSHGIHRRYNTFATWRHRVTATSLVKG